MKVLIELSEDHYEAMLKMKGMGLGYYYDAITNGKVVEDVEDGLHRDAKWKEAIKNIKADLDGVTLYECFNPNKAVENIIDKHTKELL